MNPNFKDPSLAALRPLAHYADLLEKAATRESKRSSKKHIKGLTERELEDLKDFLKRPIPSALDEWFGLCNGQVFHFNSVRVRKPESIALWMNPKCWHAPDWIPIATDGCGNFFATPFKPIAEFHPIAFFDIVDFENPDYWVASSLERFLFIYVELDHWGVCEIDQSISDEPRKSFIFSRTKAIKVDPKLAKLPRKLLPWVRANATD